MAHCANCGVSIPLGHEVWLQGKKKEQAPIAVCNNCVDSIDRVMKTETEDSNLAGALVFALAAAAVSAVAWYAIAVSAHIQVGIIAIAAGWLVAQAAMMGAGRKRGPRLQAISVAVTILAMAFSEYLIVRYYAIQFLADEGVTNIPLLLPLDTMISLIIGGIESDPLTLVFWAVAVWEAYTLPAKRQLRQVNTPSIQ
jgi:hypothetical protein